MGRDPLDSPHCPHPAKRSCKASGLQSRGYLDGFISNQGEVYLSPYLTRYALRFLKPGELVDIDGFRLVCHDDERQLRWIAQALRKYKDGTLVDLCADAGPLEAKPPALLRSKQPPTRWGYSGTVKQLFRALDGRFRGVILDDGTTLRFPPEAERRWKLLLVRRTFVHVEGTWHEAHGHVVIDVDHMGPRNGDLIPRDE